MRLSVFVILLMIFGQPMFSLSTAMSQGSHGGVGAFGVVQAERSCGLMMDIQSCCGAGSCGCGCVLAPLDETDLPLVPSALPPMSVAPVLLLPRRVYYLLEWSTGDRPHAGFAMAPVISPESEPMRAKLNIWTT